MALGYKKLIQFDLLDDAEEKLTKVKNRFFEFLRISQDIMVTDSTIRDFPSFPGSTDTIIIDELVSAIGSTLAIEGIVVKQEEIKETIQKEGFKNNLQRKQQEILNSRDVYKYIKKTVLDNKGEFVYKDKHIIDIHKHFTTKIPYVGNQPGAYRNTGTSFGDPRKVSLCKNYTDIYKAMKNFIKWLNQKNEGILTSNMIAKAIMAHYYLTEIHPFGDGNGRTARAVEAMALYANGINPYCFWSLANFWSANRNEYITHLGNIRNTCDCLDFLMWGAKGYLEEIQRIKALILKKVKQLMLQDYTRWLLLTKKHQPKEKKINNRISRIIELLTRSDRVPFDKLRSSTEYTTIYSHSSSMTQSRDLAKMKSLRLIFMSKINGKMHIEPNYEILESLTFNM